MSEVRTTCIHLSHLSVKSKYFLHGKKFLQKLWMDCQLLNCFSFRMVIWFFHSMGNGHTASWNSVFSALFYNSGMCPTTLICIPCNDAVLLWNDWWSCYFKEDCSRFFKRYSRLRWVLEAWNIDVIWNDALCRVYFLFNCASDI